MTWSIDDLTDPAPKSIFEMKLGAPVKPVNVNDIWPDSAIEWLRDREQEKPAHDNVGKED